MGWKDKEATELGAVAIRGALNVLSVADDEVEYVVMGQVLQGGAGQAPARQAAVAAGLLIETPADTINKVRVERPRRSDRRPHDPPGDHSVIVAGGMESMSNAPRPQEGALPFDWTACSST